MHEVSLLEGIIGLVEDERLKQDFARVSTIRLRLGRLGHAEPDAIRFCFDAVARGTIAEGATLDIEMIAGEGWCTQCCRTMPLAELYGACPACGHAPLRITAGNDLRLAELEVA